MLDERGCGRLDQLHQSHQVSRIFRRAWNALAPTLFATDSVYYPRSVLCRLFADLVWGRSALVGVAVRPPITRIYSIGWMSIW